MSNNPALFNAIICGVAGGNQRRWATPTVAADFSIIKAVSIAIANAVDSLIPPIAGDANLTQVALLESICFGAFSVRDAQSIQHDLTTIAQSIAGLYTALDESMEPIGRPFAMPAGGPLEVTGTTEGEQLDSFIARMVEYGILIDGR